LRDAQTWRRFWTGLSPAALAPLLLGAIITLQVLVPQWAIRAYPMAKEPLTGSALATRLTLDGVAGIIALILGYTLIMVFIGREGMRGVRTHTEMALAREIHGSLVPPLSLAGATWMIHGRSLPASEVGGDLVDAVVVEGRPMGFLADVSGHGVSAGMLMGLVKAALHTRLGTPGDVGQILASLNEVLTDLTRPNAFVTAALVTLESPTCLAYSLAGHPPILHWHAASRQVTRLEGAGMALGIRSGESYPVTRVAVAAGDVLAIVTDGLPETTNRSDAELGFEPIEAALARHADAPLPEILDSLFAVAHLHGPQQDDQTLLLLRVLGG
jgi:serine phosphatase RsbU (regulator of sigma subunit)